MRDGVAQDAFNSRVLFSQYVCDVPTISSHIHLAQYADKNPVVTSRSPSLLVRQLEACLDRQELWWIAIDVSKSTTVYF
jgi:hypothetical protein